MFFLYISIEQKSTPKRVPNITVHKLCRTHSYSNNFDADIIQMKEDYAALLSELSSTSEEKQNWVRVYMIDFAHVFPAEDNDVDNNYLEGIESLIKLLEKFLAWYSIGKRNCYAGIKDSVVAVRESSLTTGYTYVYVRVEINFRELWSSNNFLK